MSPYGSDRSPRHWTRRRVPQLLALGLVTATAEQGPRVLSLWQGAWIAALIIGAVVWGLILWSVAFHRRSRHKQEIPPQTRYNLPLEVLYTVIPGIIIAVFFYFTARDETELQKTTKNPDNLVNVVGFQWSWAFNYKLGDPNNVADDVYEVGTPGKAPTLWLPVDQSVQFELTSPDVIHSFWVPSFLYKMDVIPGRVNKFEVTPTKIGEYEGKCAELCGVDHSRMLFKVKVVSVEDYQKHLQELRAQGNTGQVRSGINMPEAAPHSGSEQ